MQIETIVPEDWKSLVSGRQELWLRVLSNNLVDLPTVMMSLSPEQQAQLAEYRKVAYYPSQMMDDGSGPEEHDYMFEDFWVFEKVGD